MVFKYLAKKKEQGRLLIQHLHNARLDSPGVFEPLIGKSKAVLRENVAIELLSLVDEYNDEVKALKGRCEEAVAEAKSKKDYRLQAEIETGLEVEADKLIAKYSADFKLLKKVFDLARSDSYKEQSTRYGDWKQKYTEAFESVGCGYWDVYGHLMESGKEGKRLEKELNKIWDGVRRALDSALSRMDSTYLCEISVFTLDWVTEEQ